MNNRNMHADDPAHPLFEAHPRSFEANRYVYPVLSRRARGISIGVNLNRDKACNFHCIYCQVDRNEPPDNAPVDLALLDAELDSAVRLAVSGQLFDGPRFGNTPEPLRRLNDIALSGDGEPTACAAFFDVVGVCAEVRRRHSLDELKLVLITNASLFHMDRVRRALEVLDANGGEIWAKLDAGTEAYYTQVARSTVPFRRILDNLAEAARARPLVIQSLFMRIDGREPEDTEIDAYADRLGEIVASGGQIKEVQVHTVARRPAEPWVAPLSDSEIDAIGDRVRARTGLAVSTFYG